MASKIPVGQTVGKAYGFAFGGFPAVLGVVWLPIAIMIGAGWWLFHDIAWPAMDFSTPDAVARTVMLTEYVAIGPLRILELIAWVCIIVIEVGLTQLALGIGGKPAAFFTLGAPFWRMLGATLIMTTILIIVVIPLVLLAVVMALIAGVIAHGAQPDQGWIAPAWTPWAFGILTVLFAAGFVGFYYVYLRLWFFIAPVVVAEKHIDIRRSWHLGKSNLWRIFLIALAIFIPLVIVMAVAEGAGVYLFFTQVRYATLPDARFWNDNWLALSAIFAAIALIWLFALALTNGARAFAYRAIVPGESRETVT